MVKVPITKDQEQQIVISFIDNTDLVTDRINSERKTQSIINKCTRLYEAIGGKVLNKKTIYYSWKWKRKNRKLHTKDEEIELNVKNERI